MSRAKDPQSRGSDKSDAPEQPCARRHHLLELPACRCHRRLARGATGARSQRVPAQPQRLGEQIPQHMHLRSRSRSRSRSHSRSRSRPGAISEVTRAAARCHATACCRAVARCRGRLEAPAGVARACGDD
jgi:hypothetical protein